VHGDRVAVPRQDARNRPTDTLRAPGDEGSGWDIDKEIFLGHPRSAIELGLFLNL
jgi:hypothetical protein